MVFTSRVLSTRIARASRRRKLKKLLKELHDKSCGLYDLGIEIFQTMVLAERDLRDRLISLEVEECYDEQYRKLDSFPPAFKRHL